IGRELRHAGIHVVPGLGALGEDVGLGPEPARIVEGADANADDVGPCRDLDIERRAAVAAEHPGDVVAGIGLGHVAAGVAANDADPGGGHAHRRDVRRAALALAIATVTLQRELRLALALVAHRTTQASAGSHGHGLLLWPGFLGPMIACRSAASSERSA